MTRFIQLIFNWLINTISIPVNLGMLCQGDGIGCSLSFDFPNPTLLFEVVRLQLFWLYAPVPCGHGRECRSVVWFQPVFFFESLSFRNPAVKWGMPRKDFCFGKSGWNTIFACLWTWGARKERNLGEATLQAKTGNGGGFGLWGEPRALHLISVVHLFNELVQLYHSLHFAFDCPPPLWEIIANFLLTI